MSNTSATLEETTTPTAMKAFTQKLIEEAKAKNNAAGAGR